MKYSSTTCINYNFTNTNNEIVLPPDDDTAVLQVLSC